MPSLLPVIVLICAAFAAFFLLRIGGAHRRSVSRYAPGIILAMAAILLAARGYAPIALVLAIGAAALLAWNRRPAPRRKQQTREQSAPPPKRGATMSDAQARAILGVQPGATEADIRSAFRRRMAKAHPDLGGSTEEAARLSAARDALLRR